jgi:hypothetical protein
LIKREKGSSRRSREDEGAVLSLLLLLDEQNYFIEQVRATTV